jgi:YgiT-type zinc finger domain-containing protein
MSPIKSYGSTIRSGGNKAMGSAIKETYSEQYVTYTLEMDGKFYLVEHVPAKVCLETGEQYFAPETVDKIQKIIWGQKKPIKFIETPVYEFGLAATSS